MGRGNGHSWLVNKLLHSRGSNVTCKLCRNKGKISAEGSRAVGEAYFRQFQRDFNAFLDARAKELVPGGRMVLLLIGRTSPDPSALSMFSLSWELLESGLNDLVSQVL